MSAAFSRSRSPTSTGSKKSIRSMEAVTHLVRACRMQTTAATSSMYFMMDPPYTLPMGLASAGIIWREDSCNVRWIGTAAALTPDPCGLHHKKAANSVERRVRVDLFRPRVDAAHEVAHAGKA